DSCFVLHNPLSYTVYRFMYGSLRPVSVRSRLEVRFEDWLQDELQGPLDYAISDRRNREDPYFGSSILRDLLLPNSHGLIRVGDQFIPNLLQKTLHSVSSMASNVTPSIPGAPLFCFASL